MKMMLCRSCFEPFEIPADKGKAPPRCPQCGAKVSRARKDTSAVADEEDEYGDDYAESDDEYSDEYDYSYEDEYEYDDYGDDDYVEEAPRRFRKRRSSSGSGAGKSSSRGKSKTGKSKKKKRKADESNVPWLMIGLGAGGGVVLLLIILLLLFSGGPSSEVAEDEGAGEPPVVRREINREQKKFASESGNPRTTSEWLDVLREIEFERKRGSNRYVILKSKARDPESFIGVDPAAVPVLFAALQDELPRIQSVAEAVLRKTLTQGERPYPEDLIEALGSDHAQTRSMSLALLATLKAEGRDATPRLIELLKSESASDVTGAITAIAAVSDAPLQHLKPLITSDDSTIQLTAIKTLGTLGQAATPAVPELLLALDSADPQVSGTAYVALETLGPAAEQAVPSLARRYTESDDDNERFAAARVLAAIGEPAVDVFLKATAEGTDQIKRDALQRLAGMSVPADRVIPALMAAATAEGQQPEIAAGALSAMGSFPDAAEETVPLLAGHLENRSALSHGAAAALIKLPLEHATVANLSTMLDYKHPELQPRVLEEVGRRGAAASETAPTIARMHAEVAERLAEARRTRNARLNTVRTIYKDGVIVSQSRPDPAVIDGQIAALDRETTSLAELLEQLDPDGNVRQAAAAAEAERQQQEAEANAPRAVAATAPPAFVKDQLPALEQYETRLSALERTPEAILELAHWCHEQGLHVEADQCLIAVLVLDPDSSEATRLYDEWGRGMDADETPAVFSVTDPFAHDAANFVDAGFKHIPPAGHQHVAVSLAVRPNETVVLDRTTVKGVSGDAEATFVGVFRAVPQGSILNGIDRTMRNNRAFYQQIWETVSITRRGDDVGLRFKNTQRPKLDRREQDNGGYRLSSDRASFSEQHEIPDGQETGIPPLTVVFAVPENQGLTSLQIEDTQPITLFSERPVSLTSLAANSDASLTERRMALQALHENPPADWSQLLAQLYQEGNADLFADVRELERIARRQFRMLDGRLVAATTDSDATWLRSAYARYNEGAAAVARRMNRGTRIKETIFVGAGGSIISAGPYHELRLSVKAPRAGRFFVRVAVFKFDGAHPASIGSAEGPLVFEEPGDRSFQFSTGLNRALEERSSVWIIDLWDGNQLIERAVRAPDQAHADAASRSHPLQFPPQPTANSSPQTSSNPGSQVFEN